MNRPRKRLEAEEKVMCSIDGAKFGPCAGDWREEGAKNVDNLPIPSASLGEPGISKNRLKSDGSAVLSLLL